MPDAEKPPTPSALPWFELPDEHGTLVRSDALLARLAVALALVGRAADREWIAAVAAVEGEMREWGVDTVWIAIPGAGEDAARVARALRRAGAAGRLLLDRDGALHRRLGAADGPLPVDAAGNARPALLIVERGGTVRYRLDGGAPPDPGPAVTWARYLAVLEPECSTCAPAWPADLMVETAEEEESRADSR